MMEVEVAPRVDLGRILSSVERECVGVVGGVKKQVSEDRSSLPVLSPPEVESIKSESVRTGISEERLLKERALSKLRDAGILW